MSYAMGRPRKRYCPRGHDTFEVGRTPDHSCVACRSGKDRAQVRLTLTLDDVERDVQEMRRRVAARKGRAA